MALPAPNQAAVTIVGTVLAAAGLNVGVLGLVAPDTIVEQPAQLAAPAQDTVDAVQQTDVPAGPEGLGEPKGHDTPNKIVALALPRPAHTAADSQTPQGSTSTELATSPTGAASSPASGTASNASSTQAAPSDDDDDDDDDVTTTAPASTAAPTTPTPTSGAPSTQTDSTEFLTYEFEGVATIIIALHDGDTLELWTVARQPGWVSRVEKDEPDKVKVKFMRLSDGNEAEFEVKFDKENEGELKVKMEH
ncbi:MAG: hypothetical protein GY724_18630 [Actinomycetia bacterium]|nr:hypothetical protein [Actinomycetes bacterium]